MTYFDPTLRHLCGLLLGGCLLVSCSDDPIPPTPPSPTVTLETEAVGETSVRFYLAATNADRAWYLAVPADRPAPDAATVAATGTAADVTQARSYTVDGLVPQTEYLVAAVAARDGLYSEVATIRCLTVQGPDIFLTAADGATYLSASFTARIDHANRAAWMLLAEGEQAEPERILADGTPLEADGQGHETSLADPDPGVVYRVAVAAANADAEAVQVLELTTLEEPPYAYSVTCTYGAGSYYGNMNNEQGTGEYLLLLTDAHITPEGYAASSGLILRFDLYSLLAPDKMDARPQSGIYRFIAPLPGASADACTEWAIGGANSDWRELDDGGVTVATGHLTDAVLEYRDCGDGTCRIAAYATLADGRNIRMLWEGPLTFGNQIPGELQDIDATEFQVVEASYLGKKNTMGSDEFVIRLADDPSNPRNSMVLDFYATPCADPGNPRISAGTYRQAGWFSTDPFTFCVGDIAFGTILMGSYVECTVDGLPMQAIIYDGTFTVADEGDAGYRFTFDLKICDTDNTLSRSLTGSTLCSFDIVNKYPIPPGDLSVQLDRVSRAAYDPAPSPGGGYGYRIELLDCTFSVGDDGAFAPASGGTGNRLVLDLWGAASIDPEAPELPEGTYWMDYSQAPGTCHGQLTMLEHFDVNGNLLPLSFWNASLTVAREGTDYVLKFSGEDTLNERITCDYSGPIDFSAATPGGNRFVTPVESDRFASRTAGQVAPHQRVTATGTERSASVKGGGDRTASTR